MRFTCGTVRSDRGWTRRHRPPLSPVFRLRVLHSKMAPKIQTRTEIRYKWAQCFLGTTYLKKSAAIIFAIFWARTRMRLLLEGGEKWGRGNPDDVGRLY